MVTKREKKRSTLSMQLSIRIFILTAFLFAMMNVITIGIVKEDNGELSEQIINGETNACVNELDSWMNGQISFMDSIKTAMKNTEYKDDKALFHFLDAALKSGEVQATDIYTGNTDGWFLDGSGWIPDSDFDATTRGWFKDGLQSDKMKVGSAYLDANTGNMAITFSAKTDNKTVLSADVSLGTIAEKIGTFSILNEGYTFLVENSTGMILAHKDTAYDGMLLSEADSAFLKQVGNCLSDHEKLHQIDDNGKTYFVKTQPISKADWTLVSCATYNSMRGDLNSMIRILVIWVIVFVVIMCVLLYIFIKQSMKPLARITEVIQKITTGDFREKAQVTGNNEITTLSETMNYFIDTMKNTITMMNTVSGELVEEATKSADSSNEVNQSAEIQEESMKQFTISVNEVSDSISEIAHNATTLANTVSTVTDSSENSQNLMGQVVAATKEGSTSMEELTKRMDEISEEISILSESVSVVGVSMEEIVNITKIIDDIASQTNLLALNASIEAARAGEAGKGFAVVATEIGNLANMSSGATTQINELIMKVNGEVKNSVSKAQDSVENMTRSAEYVEVSNKIFKHIFDVVNQTKNSIEEVTENMEKLNDIASNMAAVTQEQSASTEEMLSTAENLSEQSARVVKNSCDIMEISKKLKEHAGNMEERISDFKI